MSLTTHIPSPRGAHLGADEQPRPACLGRAPLFFHPEGLRGPVRASRDAAAKAICRTCPLIAECRTGALERREGHGVWGGLTEADRQVIWGETPAPAEPVRQCVSCGQARPEDQFPLAGEHKGRQYRRKVCQDCFSAYRRAWKRRRAA
jgi:WhiB family redox-sensing transcriptional regulator